MISKSTINLTKIITKNQKLIIFCICFVLFVSFLAIWGKYLIYRDGPYEGKIIDAETKEPIEGAVVLAEWEHYLYVLPSGGLDYFDVKETITNKKGQFNLGTFFTIFPCPICVLQKYPYITVYKPDYGVYKGSWEGRVWYGEPYKANLIKQNGDVIIELSKLKTNEERLKAVHTAINDTILDSIDVFASKTEMKKREIFIELINNECENLGLEPYRYQPEISPYRKN